MAAIPYVTSKYLSPEAEHLLDWFHLTMCLTVLQQTAKRLPATTSDGEETYPLRDEIVRELKRFKWFLWHGNVYKALQVVRSVEMALDAAVADNGDGTVRKLYKTAEEFHTYIANNKGFIPNYGERYRAGEHINAGFVESTVDQVVSKRFCKRRQMQWRLSCGAACVYSTSIISGIDDCGACRLLLHVL